MPEVWHHVDTSQAIAFVSEHTTLPTGWSEGLRLASVRLPGRVKRIDRLVVSGRYLEKGCRLRSCLDIRIVHCGPVCILYSHWKLQILVNAYASRTAIFIRGLPHIT